MPNGLRVFGGSANPALTEAICRNLEINPGQIELKRFADAELYPQILENVRGCDVFIVQPTSAPVNDNLMELMLMLNAAKLASAKRVTAVLPYYGYARQDRKDRPRVPLSAKVVAQMLQTQGIDRVLTMDLHSAPIQGFFDVPVDHLYALPVFIDMFTNRVNIDVVVSPDAGGVTRARLLAKKLGKPLAIIDKFREAANVSEVMNVIGHVEGQNCLLVDDMIDTAGTLVKGAVALMKRGAKTVRAAATHGIFSWNKKLDKSALEIIEDSPLVEVFVADTIKQQPSPCVTGVELMNYGPYGGPSTSNVKVSTKIRTLSIAKLFAEAIDAIHNDTSISDLFV